MPPTDRPLPADESLQRLKAGNRRFVEQVAVIDSHLNPRRRDELLSGQHPHTIILGCSDARVPIEIIFDQEFGDLFVIRVAGNVVQPSQVGSVEFAAAQFGTRLVVVLGHSRCGAVNATLDELQRQSGSPSRGLAAIVDRIKPAVRGLLNEEMPAEELAERAVEANVRASVDALRDGSDIIRSLVEDEGLQVVGAVYALETGAVRFLDQPGAES